MSAGAKVLAVLLSAAALGGCGQASPPGASGEQGINGRQQADGASSRQTAPPTPQTPSPARDPWQEAKARGIEFRAVGQEPGWYLEIDADKEIHFVYDYAEHEARAPVQEAVVDGVMTTYVAKTGRHLLRIILEERPCTDVMSGVPFSHTVYVRIDGAVYGGCGQKL